MSKKTLLRTIVSFGFLLSAAAGRCFADASFQIEETAVYKNRYGDKTFGDYYNVAAVSPAGNPVAWWKFEGNAGDSIGNNHGAEYGDPCYPAVVFGRAINLNGKDDYVVVPDNAGGAAIEFGSESFSITLWVKSKWAVGSEKEFIIKNGTSGSEYKGASGKRYAIKFQTQNFRFVLDDGVTKTMLNGAGTDFATGRWVHAAVVRDTAADELLLYCNGLLVSTAVDNTGGISSPSENLFIGASPQENAEASGPDSVPVGHFLSGMLGDVRIYDYALSQAEIVGVTGAGALRLPLLSSEALIDMAGRYEKSRTYGEARSIYQQVVRQYPDSSEAGRAKIDVPKMNILSLFDSKEEAAAQAALDSLIADFNDHPDLPEALYEVAKKRYQDSGNYERANSIYEKITTQWPGSEYDLKSQRNLVISYISMGETSQAWEALDKLAQEFDDDPGLAGALLSIAEIYRKAKKYEEAKSIYETVVTDYPGTEHALKAQKKLAIVYVDLDDDPNAQQAIDRLAQEFPGDPNLADALYEIAKRYEWVRGKYEQAGPIYQQIIQSFPDSSYAKEKLDLSRTNIIYLIESGNYSLAAGALTTLLADFNEHPDLAWTLDGIAGRYEKAEKYDEARSIYQKIVTDYNETDYAFTAQKKLTILEINVGDDAAAQAALDTLIADFNDRPEFPQALFSIAEQSFYGQNFRWAIKVWELILTESPGSYLKSEIPYLLATCYNHLDNYEKAIQYYKKVVEQYPNSRYGWRAPYRLGVLYKLLGDYEKAVYWYGQQRKLYSNESTSQQALFWQGNIFLFDLKDYQKAVEKFQEYIELYPESEGSPEVCYDLAMAYEKIGDKTQAIALLQEAQSLYPNSIFTRHIMDKLAELQEGVKQ
ncbi:MAG: tetratricopeptide repeat protein [Phycisphaerae bacterium]|nr:tetratricopeptide repeat protein [Phycisphaerae bacterium]